MIDTSRNTTPDVHQKDVRKSGNETKTCQCLIVEKLICQSCFFQIRRSAAQCYQDLHGEQRQKMNNSPCPKKTFYVKNF